MNIIPENIDGANIIELSFNQDNSISIQMTENNNNRNQSKFFCFAICKYKQSEIIYLFICDLNWKVHNTSKHTSIYEAKKFFSKVYKNTSIIWHHVSMKALFTIDSFDYSWPNKSILNIYVDEKDLVIEFDSFIVTLDEYMNTTGKDICTDFCQCQFLSCQKKELKIWKNSNEFYLENNISKIIGCVIQESYDMCNASGTYFCICGLYNSYRFELFIYSNEYTLLLKEQESKLDNWL